jgi:PIN domain nuclease of toxin-antitoxin system
MGRPEVILADTHVVVWLAFAEERISRKARATIDQAREDAEGLAISDMSLLELARFGSRRGIELDISVESFLQEVESRFVVLPMNSRVCAKAMALPATFPKDPADRVIAATAITEGLALITADEHIRNSKVVRTIW